MSIVTNPSTPVDKTVVKFNLAATSALKCATSQVSALALRRNYYKRVVETDVVNPGNLAPIDAINHVTHKLSALRYLVMQKSESIVNVEADMLTPFANLLLKEIPLNATKNAGKSKEKRI